MSGVSNARFIRFMIERNVSLLITLYLIQHDGREKVSRSLDKPRIEIKSSWRIHKGAGISLTAVNELLNIPRG